MVDKTQHSAIRKLRGALARNQPAVPGASPGRRDALPRHGSPRRRHGRPWSEPRKWSACALSPSLPGSCCGADGADRAHPPAVRTHARRSRAAHRPVQTNLPHNRCRPNLQQRWLGQNLQQRNQYNRPLVRHRRLRVRSEHSTSGRRSVQTLLPPAPSTPAAQSGALQQCFARAAAAVLQRRSGTQAVAAQRTEALRKWPRRSTSTPAAGYSSRTSGGWHFMTSACWQPSVPDAHCHRRRQKNTSPPMKRGACSRLRCGRATATCAT